MIEALLLDFDGTLVESEPLHWEAWTHAAAPLGVRFDWEEYQRCFVGKHDRWASEEVLRRTGAEPDSARSAALWEAKSLYYRARSAERLETPAAVVKTLAELRGREIKLALVTSSLRPDVTPTLAVSGLDDLFQALVFGEDVDHFKPDPQPYLLAAERLAIAPERCMAFEDSDSGVRSAEAAGAKVERVADPLDLLVRLRRLSETL